MNEPLPERPNPLRRSRLPLVVLALVAIGAAGYFFLRREVRAPPEQAPVAAAPQPAAGPAAPEASGAPPVDPATIPSLLESLSANETFRKWLGGGDVARRWAIVTDNIAESTSPRRQLALFAPAGSFSVARDGGKLYMTPESTRRYDRFADAIAAVDAGTAASVYRALRGTLAAAYQALGYPDRSFDRITAKALSRLERAPVRDERIEVRQGDGVYVFAEPRLEELGDVEKHLLRMGPRNARLVQAKAREIREALGFPAEVAGTGGQPGR